MTSPPGQPPLSVHVFSMHTSPLSQPGNGDAGGMNVYIAHLSAALARAGHRIEAFTLATEPLEPGEPEAAGTRSVEVCPGFRVHELYLPTARGLAKEQLPAVAEAFGMACARFAAEAALGTPDVLHAHYWLSGAAALAYRDAWDTTQPRDPDTAHRNVPVPMVLTLHTSARVKNLQAGPGEPPEPESRGAAEERLVGAAAAVIVNTEREGRDMVEEYGAAPESVHVVPPGVDASVFRPAPGPATVRDAAHGFRVLFAGRPQPLKGPEILIRAVAAARRDVPSMVVEIHGSAAEDYLDSLRRVADECGVGSACEFRPASSPEDLAAAIREADVVACPSSSETFGLVALEAQACGTPVVGSDVSGLRVALDAGRAGLLVPERTPDAWARALLDLASDPPRRERLRAEGLRHARSLTWDAAAQATSGIYRSLTDRSPRSTTETP